MSNGEEEMESGGDTEHAQEKRRSSGGGKGRLGGSFGYTDENEDDDEEPQGNDALAIVPRDGGLVVEKKSNSDEEDGEIDDDDEEPDPLKTKEAVEDAAKAWLKKGEEAKKKELLGFGYKIRPDLDEKFRPGDVQVLIEKIVRDHLDGHVYEAEEMPKIANVITDEIQVKVRALKYKRYKLITYVVLGERRGEGVNSVTRCIWDAESDCMQSFTFLNETIFCCATVYGIFYY